MSFSEAFGKIKESNLASGAVQKLSAYLRAYITEHYYPCTPQTLKGLDQCTLPAANLRRT